MNRQSDTSQEGGNVAIVNKESDEALKSWAAQLAEKWMELSDLYASGKVYILADKCLEQHRKCRAVVEMYDKETAADTIKESGKEFFK